MDEDGGSSGELYRAMFCRAFFFYCLDVLVDDGVSGDTYPLCFFVTCSVSDGMGK